MSTETCPTSALRLHGRHVRVSLREHRRGLRHGEERRRHRVDGRHEPRLVMRNIIPVVMAALGVEGSSWPSSSSRSRSRGGERRLHDQVSSFSGYAYLSAGLCCGLSGLAAGMAIGVVGDAGVRAVGQQEKLFVGMILILIFAEALGLYGLIVALILSQQSAECTA